MHKYIYSNHLSGGVFLSDERIPEEFLFCGQCGDSNQEIGEADTFSEAWQQVCAYGGLSLNGAGGFALDYLFPTLYNEFYPDRQIETDEHGCCDLTEEAIIRQLWEDERIDLRWNISYLCAFLRAHPADWEAGLKNPPYLLTIKREGKLAIFNYDLIAEEKDLAEGKTYHCDFRLPEVQEARGIILDTECNRVVCWPFRKFANFGESYADEIDWVTARVEEKLDGSIVKLWYDYGNEKWRCSSNTVIDADQAMIDGTLSIGALFREAAFKQHLDYDILDRDRTYIFELTGPRNQVVIRYPETELYHIGTRDNYSGQEYDEDIGIQKPDRYPLRSLEDCIRAAEALNADKNDYGVTKEGFVVVDRNWHRIKVKSPKYVMIAHMVNGGRMSKKNVLRIVMEGEQEEYLVYYPYLRDAFADCEHQLRSFREEMQDAFTKYSRLWEELKHDRKAFAIQVKKDKRGAWAFMVANGVESAKEIFESYSERRLLKELEGCVSDES